ncbi:metallophosphoesterase family protein [Engelhardtia mirabilis]|uniref:Putative metallophosphoesterase YhaO n=1 Tax=Engelhardtia mirabilis TaxID=2528011 RepID=A0A518BF16_9BACT|nr:putative metallophosphoesterase YhaO [Planctomycetes bacterium Pla133]QDU99896.1 putative metallophosphoesterase YhaO [Planctomycetes bacterium Pla86]
MTVNLVLVGDMHLGRRPTRVPRQSSLDPADLGPEVAWQRTVDLALEQKVAAVLLAGDVVERIEDRFRAFAALERGVARLVGAGIRVIAVVGNHDVEALPRLAARIGAVELLGMGEERWQSALISAGGTSVRVWGWSFRRREERNSPLADFPRRRARPGDEAVIGLLHADLDVRDSNYAPVNRGELVDAGLDAWVLGHVHRPHDLAGGAPIGYLGSVAGLDPGEPGPHGPWLLEVAGPHSLRFKHVPLAPLRYQTVTLDVSSLPDVAGADLADALASQLEREVVPAFRAAAADELERVDALALRVVLEGDTERGTELRAATRELIGQELSAEVTPTFITSFEDRSTAPVDLRRLAGDSSYPGLLARRLMALESGDEEGQRLIARARERLTDDLARHASWRQLPDELARPDDDEILRGRLVASGRRALQSLLAQNRGTADGGDA